MTDLALESVVPGDGQVEERVSGGRPGVHGDDDRVHAPLQELHHLVRALALTRAQPGHQVQQVRYDPQDLQDNEFGLLNDILLSFQCF